MLTLSRFERAEDIVIPVVSFFIAKHELRSTQAVLESFKRQGFLARLRSPETSVYSAN